MDFMLKDMIRRCRGRNTYYGMVTIVGEASPLCPSSQLILK